MAPKLPSSSSLHLSSIFSFLVILLLPFMVGPTLADGQDMDPVDANSMMMPPDLFMDYNPTDPLYAGGEEMPVDGGFSTLYLPPLGDMSDFVEPPLKGPIPPPFVLPPLGELEAQFESDAEAAAAVDTEGRKEEGGINTERRGKEEDGLVAGAGAKANTSFLAVAAIFSLLSIRF